MNSALNFGSETAKVYEAVKETGAIGVRLKALLAQFPDRTGKSVEGTVSRLKQARLITQDGRGGSYRVDSTCVEPVIRGRSPRAMLLELIGDCAGGISAKLLCETAGMGRPQTLRHLQLDLASGKVLEVKMPASHGGGIGYMLASEPVDGTASPEAPKPLAARVTVATPADLVFKDGRVSLALPESGQYRIGWGGMFDLTLPRDVTRAVFQHLDRLGGLNNTRLLPPADQATAEDAACV